jgi:hypothetical protein
VIAVNSKFNPDYLKRLRNRLYGVLCEREKGGEWEKFLDSIIIELLGASEEQKTVGYYVLVAKLSSCRFLEYKYFRTTVLECMGIFDKL